MVEGDIAFKCNFATYDTATGVVVKRRADRQFEQEGPILCAHLDSKPSIVCLSSAQMLSLMPASDTHVHLRWLVVLPSE